MKEVIILGIGPSRIECPFDAEVWASARALTVDGLADREYSKVFAFDSRTLPALKKPISIAIEKGIPIVSTKEYATERYPLQEVIKDIAVDFTKNTISYMIAYAIYLGYKKIRLYGVDQAPEWDYMANRPYVLFWLGVAHGKGVKIELAKGTLLNHLMKLNTKRKFEELKKSKDWSQVVWAEKGPVFVKGQDVKVKITGGGYKPLKRKRVWHRRDILAYLILFALYLIRPFRMIKLCYIRSIAIGQQAGNTGVFLRQLQLYRPKGISYIGISAKPDNRQLLKMFKRKMCIIESRVLSDIHREGIIARSPFFQDLPFPMDAYDEFRTTKCDIEFTAKEEEQGQAFLRKMGIGKDNWFVCFLARDDAFMINQSPNRQYNGEFRNSNIDNFMKAAKYITDCGGYAIRMGYFVSKELKTKNPMIIDYASNYRTDFMDIYLLDKCKFYLGDTAGMWCLANVLNTPVAGVNFIQFHTPLRKGDMFIPKRLWSNDLKRYLTLREFIEFDGHQYMPSNVHFLNKLLNSNHEVIENTAKEILDLTREMNERLDGTWKGGEEAQKRFHEILKPEDYIGETPALIGSNFSTDMTDPSMEG